MRTKFKRSCIKAGGFLLALSTFPLAASVMSETSHTTLAPRKPTTDDYVEWVQSRRELAEYSSGGTDNIDEKIKFEFQKSAITVDSRIIRGLLCLKRRLLDAIQNLETATKRHWTTVKSAGSSSDNLLLALKDLAAKTEVYNNLRALESSLEKRLPVQEHAVANARLLISFKSSQEKKAELLKAYEQEQEKLKVLRENFLDCHTQWVEARASQQQAELALVEVLKVLYPAKIEALNRCKIHLDITEEATSTLCRDFKPDSMRQCRAACIEINSLLAGYDFLEALQEIFAPLVPETVPVKCIQDTSDTTLEQAINSLRCIYEEINRSAKATGTLDLRAYDLSKLLLDPELGKKLKALNIKETESCTQIPESVPQGRVWFAPEICFIKEAADQDEGLTSGLSTRESRDSDSPHVVSAKPSGQECHLLDASTVDNDNSDSDPDTEDA